MSDYDDYESGPFCRHWGDPSDCEIKCARCDCRCTRHGAEDSDSSCYNCGCKEWGEPE